MRDRPDGTAPQRPGPGAYQAPGQERSEENPQSIGDAIQAFVASGGLTTFLFGAAPPFNAQLDGIQLLTSVYVPRGRTGWIKGVRCAPYCPAVLADPWQGWPATWQDFIPVGAALDSFRATARGGYYTTPMGWESYFSPGTEVLPQWQWWITCMPGSIGKAKAQAQSAPTFSLADPSSWYLAESIPVPASVYPQGVPGRAPGGRFEPQRMQALADDAINWHLQIPEDNTAMLWASWKQSTVSVQARDTNGDLLVFGEVHPLLPSFGQLIGYTQATSSPAAVLNSRNGWGG
jgi:hypothetical protein